MKGTALAPNQIAALSTVDQEQKLLQVAKTQGIEPVISYAEAMTTMHKHAQGKATDEQIQRAAASELVGWRVVGDAVEALIDPKGAAAPNAKHDASRVKRDDLPINNDRIKRCRKIAHIEPFHEWIRAMREHGHELTQKATIALGSLREDAQQRVIDMLCEGVKPNVALRLAKREELAASSRELPEGSYRVIQADPPWRYGDEKGFDAYSGTAAEGHYPTMAVEEIRDLDVKNLAADNAVLFLWATFPLLPEAISVIPAWGFAYKTAFVWDKGRPNVGNYHNASAELLLVGTRGSCVPEFKGRVEQIQRIKRTGRHSEKPVSFYTLIDQLYPTGPRIELFTRGAGVAGWDTWGNEASDVA